MLSTLPDVLLVALAREISLYIKCSLKIPIIKRPIVALRVPSQDILLFSLFSHIVIPVYGGRLHLHQDGAMIKDFVDLLRYHHIYDGNFPSPELILFVALPVDILPSQRGGMSPATTI